MLFWFTKSLSSLLCLITDTNLTIWRGGIKNNQNKPKEERAALASAVWNSSHTPPSLSFVPLSVMLRNRRPLKSALMRPKKHFSLLSPLTWCFWHSGFGSHTLTHTHPQVTSHEVMAHWVFPCGVSSNIASCLCKFWLMSWPGCYRLIIFLLLFSLSFFSFFLFCFHERQSNESGVPNKLKCCLEESVIRGQGSKQH